MNYNSLMNKPTINYRELIGDNTVTEVGGITEEEFNTLLTTDLSSYYTKAQINDLFSRSYVYREKSGSIVTFDCPSTSQSIPEVTVGIEAVQSGTGDPSPTNVRPISGWSAVNVVVSPTTDAKDGTTYTTQLKDGQGNPMTCYGGTLDVVSGVLTVDRGIVDLGNLTYTYDSIYNRFASSAISNLKRVDVRTLHMQSSCYKCVWHNESIENVPNASFYNSNNESNIYIHDSRFDNATNLKNALSGQKVVYPLATPLTIQLTPTAVKSLLGTNNLWADSGDIEVKCLDRIIPAGE